MKLRCREIFQSVFNFVRTNVMVCCWLWMRQMDVVWSCNRNLERFAFHRQNYKYQLCRIIKGNYYFFDWQLVLNYTNESGGSQLSWMPSSNTTHDSYIICQLEWYHVHITKHATKLSMVINKTFEVTSAILDGGDLMGSLFLGQITGKVVTTLIISMTKLLDADWSRGVQLFH